jgi:NADH-quinone oxidoreductase subunit H
MKFAMFYLAEYINMTTVSALAVTLFLGGWRAPVPLSLWAGANSGWWPMLWFVIKVMVLLFCFVWLRGTLPRVRYDQLMAIGWKVLIPVSIVWILLIATVRAWQNDRHSPVLFVVGVLILVILLGLVVMWDSAAQKRAAEEEQAQAQAAGGESPAFPVPPLDLPHYHGLFAEDHGIEIEAEGNGATSPKEVTGA